MNSKPSQEFSPQRTRSFLIPTFRSQSLGFASERRKKIPARLIWWPWFCFPPFGLCLRSRCQAWHARASAHAVRTAAPQFRLNCAFYPVYPQL